MHRCVGRTIAMLILDFMKLVVSEQDFPDFLARRPARILASFPSTPSHETTKGEKWRRWSRQAWRIVSLVAAGIGSVVRMSFC